MVESYGFDEGAERVREQKGKRLSQDQYLEAHKVMQSVPYTHVEIRGGCISYSLREKEIGENKYFESMTGTIIFNADELSVSVSEDFKIMGEGEEKSKLLKMLKG